MQWRSITKVLIGSLLSDANLIFLDEPLDALDADSKIQSLKF